MVTSTGSNAKSPLLYPKTKARAHVQFCGWMGVLILGSHARLLGLTGRKDLETQTKKRHTSPPKSPTRLTHVHFTRTQGRAEEDLKALGLDRLSIYRPGCVVLDVEECPSGGAHTQAHTCVCVCGLPEWYRACQPPTHPM